MLESPILAIWLGHVIYLVMREEMDEEGENHIQRVAAREYPAKSLETTEWSLALAMLFVELAIVFPGGY